MCADVMPRDDGVCFGFDIKADHVGRHPELQPPREHALVHSKCSGRDTCAHCTLTETRHVSTRARGRTRALDSTDLAVEVDKAARTRPMVERRKRPDGAI